MTLVAPGTCSITASQAGNGNYLAATTATQSFTVNLEPQTITFGQIGNVKLGAAPFAVTATASSNLSVNLASTTLPVCTISGSTVTTWPSVPARSRQRKPAMQRSARRFRLYRVPL